MKNKSSILATALVAAASLQLAGAADITGKITLKGKPPETQINDKISSDPFCGKLHKEPVKIPLYIVGANGELADVVVYIKEGLTGKTYEVPAQAVLLDQVGCEYKPYVFGIQTKQKLLIKNSDPVMHNVHVIPKAAGNKESNQAQMPKGKDMEKTFDSPELFMKFECNVHPWMFAYATVFEHPYFSVTDKEGRFTIKNVPAGKYTIEAKHRKAGAVTKEVTVGKDNQTADMVLELKPAP